MDGVVHKIDSVLLPPSLSDGNQDFRKERSTIGSFIAWLWPWSHNSKIGVMELMDSLQPFLAEEI